jgi:DNA-binding response OmpR family regulator
LNRVASFIEPMLNADWEAAALRKPSILVVEDHPDTQSALAEHFEERGWNVAVASDGEAALRLARESPPDIVCLDLNLPNSSGYDVCEQMRADPTLETVIILMTSARSTLDVRAFALDAGADAYLSKPYKLDELVAVIERLCQWDPLPSSVPEGRATGC